LMKKPGEVCDDDNPTDGKGCKPDCSGPLDGWVCAGGTPSTPMTCNTVCGDDIIAGDEECEDNDGGPTSLDGCSNLCKKEVDWTCTTATNTPIAPKSLTTCVGNCMDGKMKAGEVCDDGGTVGDGVGCKDDCFGPELGWSCTGGTATTPITCVTVCGDGIIAGSEQCEDNDGGPTSLDGCNNLCQKEAGWTCTTFGHLTGCLPICGDGIRVAAETCDDGNKVSFDGCDQWCGNVELLYECLTPGVACTLLCGNGVIDPLENCEDTNAVSGDGCSSACITEPLYECPTLGSSCNLVCSNGVLDPGEACDDGNAIIGDGCTDNCTIEISLPPIIVEEMYVSPTNEIILYFNDTVASTFTIAESHLHLSISGKLHDSYKFTYVPRFNGND
jgi:cysteine-rich repeat protein